jgi:hypothetical protein
MVETSEVNGLDPFKYRTYLFTKLSNMDFRIHPELLDSVLPWNDEIQQKCK